MRMFVLTTQEADGTIVCVQIFYDLATCDRMKAHLTKMYERTGREVRTFERTVV